MIGNIWFDRDLGRTVYNIGDPDYVLLTRALSGCRHHAVDGRTQDLPRVTLNGDFRPVPGLDMTHRDRALAAAQT